MSGVAADGVSPLLLRVRLPDAGTIRWTLSDPEHPGVTDLLGTLTTLDSAQTGITIDANVDSIADEHIAFALYTAPADFERAAVPGDVSVAKRPLRVEVSFLQSSPDSVTIARDLVIERSTVMFLHGFLESPNDWAPFKSIKTGIDTLRWGKDRVNTVDYESTSGAALIDNAAILADELATATKDARDRGIAAAQVDIVAHSMGGLYFDGWPMRQQPTPSVSGVRAIWGKGTTTKHFS